MKFFIYLILPILIVFTVLSSTTLAFSTDHQLNPKDNYKFSQGFINAFNDLADQAQLTNGFKTTVDVATSAVNDVKSLIDDVRNGNIGISTVFNVVKSMFKFFILPFVLFLEPLIVLVRISVWITRLFGGLYIYWY